MDSPSKNRIYPIVLILFLVFFGCTRSYNVKPFLIKDDLVPELRIKDPVRLVSAQAHGTKLMFLDGVGMNWEGDLGEWTDQAVGLLAIELKKRNVTIADDAPTTLRLKVTDGKLDHGFSGVECRVVLQVNAENGYGHEYVGRHISHSPIGEQARYHAGAGALTKAVTALLKDPEILRYLRE
jgi:hypothetical protein